MVMPKKVVRWGKKAHLTPPGTKRAGAPRFGGMVLVPSRAGFVSDGVSSSRTPSHVRDDGVQCGDRNPSEARAAEKQRLGVAAAHDVDQV